MSLKLNKQSRQRIFRYGLVGVLLCVILSGAILTARVFADSSAGEGGSITGGKCGDKSSTSWFDICYGAVWKYYTDLEEDGTKVISGSSSGNVKGGTIGSPKPCGDPNASIPDKNADGTVKKNPDGTDKMTTGFKKWSGYYRLALEKYNPSIYNGSNPAGAALNAEIGIIKNNTICSVNGYRKGCTNFQVVNGGVTLEAAHAAFDIAKSKGGVPDSVSDWNSDLGWFCWDDSWGTPSNPGTPPTTPPGGGGGGSTGIFTSRSTAISHKPGSAPDAPEQSSQSGDDGSAYLYAGTDYDSFRTYFTHEIKYDVNVDTDKHDEVDTYWEVYDITVNGDGTVSKGTKRASGYLSFAGGHSKSYSTLSGFSDDGYTITINTNNMSGPTITLSNKGSIGTGCQGIFYNNKVNNYTEDDGGYRSRVKSGEGFSYACINVRRPEDPTGTPWSGSPQYNGTPTSDKKYVGELSNIGYEQMKAKVYPVRRAEQYQEIVYSVPATVNYEAEGSRSKHATGNLAVIPRTMRDPCTHYGTTKASWSSAIPGSGCSVLNSTSISYSPSGATEEVTKQAYNNTSSVNRSVVNPDYVGYKYCNSAGWYVKYYYGTQKDGGSVTWHEDPNNAPYWVTYDAACRPISKKPSISVWNGSAISAGGAKTSLSERYVNTAIGTIPLHGGDRSYYGSWTEYLAVFGSRVTNLTSGASLALGNSASGDIFYTYSPLTIANKPQTKNGSVQTNLGFSGIVPSTTLRNRLNTFLKPNDPTCSNNCSATGLGLGNPVAETRQINIDGNLTIDSNIILANQRNYNSIYELPQVVIFVSGDVYINSDVTEIDAWLIVEGTIHTCKEYTAMTQHDREQIGTDAYNYQAGYNVCRRQLVFNGPVIAQNLDLRRSFGSDNIVNRVTTFNINGNNINSERLADNITRSADATQKYSAAEVFNLRMDTYLWAYAQAGRYDSSYTESYLRELAPRY